MTEAPRGGDKRGGAWRGGLPISIQRRYVPRHVALGVRLEGDPTILKLPLELEELFDRIDPDWLGYDATFHSPRSYTIVLLTLDYRYTAWRAVQADDGHWSMNPLDWAGTFQLVTFDEG